VDKSKVDIQKTTTQITTKKYSFALNARGLRHTKGKLLGTCPKVSSGVDQKADGHIPKGKFVIQRIHTETTTENLATPFEELSKENLRADSKGNTLENSKNDLTENPRENTKFYSNYLQQFNPFIHILLLYFIL